jgi:predicted enzyme related to lactoylglutathione lyase
VSVTHVFASIPVADLDAAVAWYERFLGRSPDLIPNDSEAAWRVTETGWIYVVADPSRVGSSYCTLLVDDIDAFVSGCLERGVASDPVETMADVGVRRTTITDPDGNRIQVGQPPS